MKRFLLIIAAGLLGGLFAEDADACTGISLNAADGSRVVARTVEWAASPMQCGYVVAPRGHEQLLQERLVPTIRARALNCQTNMLSRMKRLSQQGQD